MDQPKLNLNDLLPPWEHELPDAGDETELNRILRTDLHVTHPAGGEYSIGQSRPLAQDIFRALVVRQGRVKVGL